MNWLWYILSGLCAGVAAGMGMGGGTLLIPVLTLALGLPQHAAQGVNVLAFLPAAVAALVIHAKAGRLPAHYLCGGAGRSRRILPCGQD